MRFGVTPHSPTQWHPNQQHLVLSYRKNESAFPPKCIFMLLYTFKNWKNVTTTNFVSQQRACRLRFMAMLNCLCKVCFHSMHSTNILFVKSKLKTNQTVIWHLSSVLWKHLTSNKSQSVFVYTAVLKSAISLHNLWVTIKLFSAWVPGISAIVILKALPNTLDRHPRINKPMSEPSEMKG